MTTDAGRKTQDAGQRPLRVAMLPMTASDHVASNAEHIARGIDAAAASNCQVLLTPECVLCGYPSAARSDVRDINRCALADTEDALLLRAERAGILLVLGSAEHGPDGWTDDAIAGGAVPAVRYRKRHLTPIDVDHFTPGDRTVVVEHAGWRLGLAICYDLRAASVFADLAHADADAFLVIAHMAGADPDPGVKSSIVPQFCAVRAAEWATPLVFCNTTAADAWCPSGAWDARGVPLDLRAESSLLHVHLPPRNAHHPWYTRVRADHLAR